MTGPHWVEYQSHFYNLNNIHVYIYMTVTLENDYLKKTKKKKQHHLNSHPGSCSAHDWGDFSVSGSISITSNSSPL